MKTKPESSFFPHNDIREIRYLGTQTEIKRSVLWQCKQEMTENEKV